MLGWDLKGSVQRLWSREDLKWQGRGSKNGCHSDGDNAAYFLCVGTCVSLRLPLGNKFWGVREPRQTPAGDYPGGRGTVWAWRIMETVWR